MFTVTVQGRTCAFGIDVSNNNGQQAIDAAQVAARGFVFVVAKATEGRSFRDRFYPANRDRTKAAGMLFGAYHWLKPTQPLGDQVANFLAHTSNAAGCDFVACDAEEKGLTDDLVASWCEQVQAATGLPVWLYCGAYTDPAQRSDRWLRFTPWLAAYPVDADNDDDPTDIAAARAPGPWGRWDVWQYDSDGTVPGVAGDCDLNVIDVAVLAALNHQEDPMAGIKDDPEGLDAIAKRVRDYLVSADPTVNPGVVVSPQIYSTLTGLSTGVAQLVAAKGTDAAELERALTEVLSEHFNVQLTLTPKG